MADLRRTARAALERVERDHLRSADLLTEPRALEIIARHALGELSHSQMMRQLMERRYGPTTLGAADPRSEAAWSDVEHAHLTGLLSGADYLTLAAEVDKTAVPAPPDPVAVYDALRETANRLAATLRRVRGATAALPEVRAMRARIAEVDLDDLAGQRALAQELHRRRERLIAEHGPDGA